MKCVVYNVVGMAMAVACMALVVNRPVQADEKDGSSEKKPQIRVRIQKNDKDGADVAGAVKKALQARLDALPETVRKKIHQKLESAQKSDEAAKRVLHIQQALAEKQEQKSARDRDKTDESPQVIVVRLDASKSDESKKETAKSGHVMAKAIVIGADGKPKTIDLHGALSGDFAKQVASQAKTGKVANIRVLAGKLAESLASAKDAKGGHDACPGCPNCDAKHAHAGCPSCPGCGGKRICVAVAVDGEKSAKDQPKTITLTLQGDQIHIDGKPAGEHAQGHDHAHQHGDETHKREIKVEVHKTDDGAKRVSRRQAIFVGKDGTVQKFDVAVDVDEVKTDQAPHAHHSDAKKKSDKAAPAAKKRGTQQQRVRVQAVRVGTNKTAPAFVVQRKPGDHPRVLHAVPATRAAVGVATVKAVPVDVAKKLQSIESELKRIRKLLEEMTEEDDD